MKSIRLYDRVYADEAVGVTSKEGRAVSGPGKTGAVGRGKALAVGHVVLGLEAEVSDGNLGLKVPDLDRRAGCSAQPVAVGREHKRVDDVVSIKLVQELALGQVEEHSGTVLATGCAERSIGGNGYAVEVALVANKVGAELAVRQVPYLNKLVPASRNDERVANRRREANARDPLGVLVIGDGVLALAEGVPELDGLVATARNDLTVVGREGYRENILLVSNKAAGGSSGVEVPQAEGGVPRARESKLAIRGDNNILNKVVVAGERTASETEVLVVGKSPDDDRLITRTGENHVGVLGGGSNSSYPALMAFEHTAKSQVLAHLA
mmetsp:Transcript_4219/g.7394  ORF Transcript_4219/g.7394 Transcript_4219/m.7394 type:complete len:324 (+) Transcript_4219:19-990(+)